MAEGKSKWAFPLGLALIVLAMIAASLIFQHQIGQTGASVGAPQRNTVYVNQRGQVVGRDTTFQRCQRQCESICDAEYPHIAECLRRQSDCTYRCEADQR